VPGPAGLAEGAMGRVLGVGRVLGAEGVLGAGGVVVRGLIHSELVPERVGF